MDVELSDGMFEVVLIRMPTTLFELNNIVLALLSHDMSVNGVLAFRTSKLEVQCDEPLAWTLDGEYGGAPLLGVARPVIKTHGNSKAPAVICPGLTVHNSDGSYTPAAHKILRLGFSLEEALKP